MSTVPASPGTKRIAGRTWASVGTGIGAGFLLGTLAGGGFELVWDELSAIIEILVSGPLLVAGAFGFAFLAGRAVRLSPMIRYGLVVAAVAGAFLLGFTGAPELAEEGPDDLSAWIDTVPGILGLALVATSLVGAAAVSFKRFPATGLPEPDPGLEEAVRY